MSVPRNPFMTQAHVMKTFDFAGKTVVVTGASMGIGAAFARELTRRGAEVVLVARSRDKLEKLARELEGAKVIAEDLAQPGAAGRILDAVIAMGLDVDVLVNNFTALLSRSTTREFTAKLTAKLMKPRMPQLGSGRPAGST